MPDKPTLEEAARALLVAMDGGYWKGSYDDWPIANLRTALATERERRERFAARLHNLKERTKDVASELETLLLALPESVREAADILEECKNADNALARCRELNL